MLVSTIDFRYIKDVIMPAEAVEILLRKRSGMADREMQLVSNGYPAYTTQVGKIDKQNRIYKRSDLYCVNNMYFYISLLGWMGYSDDFIRSQCREYLKKGFNAFKLKVGRDFTSDVNRCRILREEIGWENKLVNLNYPFSDGIYNCPVYNAITI